MAIEVNGKVYPLWSQFIEGKQRFIGGTLEDFGDSMDRRLGFEGGTTVITDIELKPNGDDSAFFQVVGEEFTCGFDVSVGGVTGGEKGWLTLSGYGGHTFRFKAKE